jgi:WD40 repeat protein
MTDARIFVSYARKDGTDAARALRQRLGDTGLSVWQDLVALQGGRDWWSQIEEALRSKSLEHLVLVLTPEALSRPVIRSEIRLARQEGKQVHPVRGPGLDLSMVPRWMGHVIDADIPEQWDRLVTDLKGPSRQSRVPMMAPEPPADFAPRPKEFAELKAALLTGEGYAKSGGLAAITAALRGAGGYGKTTLAKALAHDPDAQEAFCDGILWVELGERPSNLLGAIIDLIQRVTGERPVLETFNAAASALSETLGDKRILLVVDDCWNAADLKPFLQGGRNTTRLVTTRLDRVLPVQAFRLPVGAMQPADAVGLLGAGLSDAVANRPELQALASRLGEWAQLLKLANGFLRNRVARGEALCAAIANANRRLDDKGLVAFDAGEEGDRTKAIAQTIEVSLELLDETKRERFGDLAVFPEDVDVPIEVAAALWAKRLDPDDTEDLLTELHGLSLLLGLDYEKSLFRFHDMTRAYLRAVAGAEGLRALHARLVAALQVASSPAAKKYALLYLPEHLREADDSAGLDALLTDPAWIDEKIALLGGVAEIVSDYERFANLNDPLQPLIGRALRLAAGPIARDVRQRMPQLHGRLLAHASQAFLESLESLFPADCIYEVRPALTFAGAELARLEGHSSEVKALTVLPDGRLASCSGGFYSTDHTIRIWDLGSGAELARLAGHKGSVNALVMLPDGRLASGSGAFPSTDATIRIWDQGSGAELACLEGHSGSVTALAVLPDGRLASGSNDETIRIWDPRSGAELARLTGHSEAVKALAVLPDGRLASGSTDHTIRIWDLGSGMEQARLEGHSGSVTALAVLPDGRLASGSWDETIRIWDPNSGAEVARLEGNGDWVDTLAVLPDGCLASGLHDRTIRIWDPSSGAEVARLKGHNNQVNALAALPDGRLASGSTDATIRIWDLGSGMEQARLAAHDGEVSALAILPDGRLASGSGWDSNDDTIRIWDPGSGDERIRLESDGGGVAALAVLPDGRLASGGIDIRIWDAPTGVELNRLEGHSSAVWALAVLPDGRLASGSEYPSIQIWDPRSGARLLCMEGHSDFVTALAVLPDGRLASGSWDKTIRIWDPNSGAEVARLEGNIDWVNALAVLPDGRLVSGSDDQTIHLWDPASGRELARLEGHSGSVNALAVLPDGRLASGSWDNTIRIWEPRSRAELARLEVDAGVCSLVAMPNGRLVAGDRLGRIHWLAIKGAGGVAVGTEPIIQRALITPSVLAQRT